MPSRVRHLLIFMTLSMDFASAAAETCSAPVIVTAEQLKVIAPDAYADAAACTAATTGKTFMKPEECAPVDVAANGITAALAAQKVMSIGQAAAGIVYMVRESASFLYNHNHNSDKCSDCAGRPGQGTYSMMMPDNLALYAAANGVAADPDPETLLASLNAVPAHAFGTPYWYMAKHPKCGAAVLAGLDLGTEEGIMPFAECTGTGEAVVADMKAKFASAVAALSCAGGGAAVVPAGGLTPPKDGAVSPTDIMEGPADGTAPLGASGSGLQDPAIPEPSATLSDLASGSGQDEAESASGSSAGLSDSEPTITKPILSKSASPSGSSPASPDDGEGDDDMVLFDSSGATGQNAFGLLGLPVLVWMLV